MFRHRDHYLSRISKSYSYIIILLVIVKILLRNGKFIVPKYKH